MNDDLLTLSEAAKVLNVSKATICNWSTSGKLDFVQLPNKRKRYCVGKILNTNTAGTTSTTKKNKQTVSSTAEYQQENKEMTSKDKSSTSRKNTQTTESSRTSRAVLTTKEEVFKHWWKKSCKEMLMKLWLPTETVCVDSVSSYSSSCSNNTKQRLLYSTIETHPKKKKWYKTSFQSLQSFPPGLMVLESTLRKSKKTLKYQRQAPIKRKKIENHNLSRTRIIKLTVTPIQRRILRQWFGTARYCYNQVIALHKKNPKLPLTYTTRDNILKQIPFEHKNISLEVKREAIQEAFHTIKKGGDRFNFRTRKSNKESICVIPSGVSVKRNTIFPTLIKPNIKIHHKITSPAGACKLVRKYNDYYLHLTTEIQQPKIDNRRRKLVCGLDPGTSTFQNYYSPTSCGKIGENADMKLLMVCKRLDKLISIRDKEKDRKRRYRLRKAINRLRKRIINKRDDLHWKAASFLCSNYNYIFLPHFETQQMCKKSSRKIGSRTARNILTLAHFEFSKRLESKAQEKGVTVFKLHEPYTSKLCGKCFTLHTNLKLKDRVYKCKACKTVIDRDYNAARNILLRGIGLLKEQNE